MHFVPAVDPMLAVGLDEARSRADVAASPCPRRRAVRDSGRRVERASARWATWPARWNWPPSSTRSARAPSRLYFASGSRGTQAGLTLGAHLCTATYRLYGVAVSAGEPEKVERARRVAREAAARLGAATR